MKDFFSGKPYPGRFIIIGMDTGVPVILYGATGRSASSLKRRFVELEDGIYMTAVDATVKIEGNPELLEYPAIRYFENGIAVANGNHIERLDPLETRGARQQLSYALAEEAYEPDEYRTPRITGCVIQGKHDAALHIIRSSQDGIDRSSWDVPLLDGEGRYLSTYIGGDVRPTPSFKGEPETVKLSFGSAETAAKALYDATAPANGAPDYRVGFIAVYMRGPHDRDVQIVNVREL